MNLNIVWLGELDFPFGLAGAHRLSLILNGMSRHGVCGTVINTFGIHDREAGLKIKTEGVYKNINYIFASGSPYRSNNFFARNIRKVWGVINEIYIIYKLRKKGQLDAAIMVADKFKTIVFYWLVSKWFDFPLIMNCVELVSSLSTKGGVRHKIDSFFYEKYGFYLLDGIMPISDFLVDFVRKQNPKLPIIKVPVITDIDRFNSVEKTIKDKYFLFCGAAIYIEIIVFILKAFERLECSEEIRLYLIVNGSLREMNRLNREIANNEKKNLVEIYSRLTDSQLTELYASACGLLIPLRPNVQDTARFPHKIGEYLASGNPIITTNIGEVKIYFKDGISALIADNYDISEFSEKMKFVAMNPDKAKEIGQNGRKICLQYFDYRQHSPRIKEFINSIILQKNNS